MYTKFHKKHDNKHRTWKFYILDYNYNNDSDSYVTNIIKAILKTGYNINETKLKLISPVNYIH